MKHIKHKKQYASLRVKNKKGNTKPKFIVKRNRNLKLKDTSIKRVVNTQTQNVDKKRVQICGLFNSGTNLMTNIVNGIFDVKIGNEGHLDFWKHTVVGKKFAKNHIKKNTLHILVTKNPYFQFHSFKKQLYSIKTKNTDDINLFVKQTLSIKPPRFVVTDTSTLEFKNFPHYWNCFYRNALQNIPNIIVVKYEDLLFNSLGVVEALKKFMPAKNINIEDTLATIINTPSKESGKPRFGDSAKSFYDSQNIPNLFNTETFNWINTNLDSDIMNALDYSFN